MTLDRDGRSITARGAINPQSTRRCRTTPGRDRDDWLTLYQDRRKIDAKVLRFLNSRAERRRKQREREREGGKERERELLGTRVYRSSSSSSLCGLAVSVEAKYAREGCGRLGLWPRYRCVFRVRPAIGVVEIEFLEDD